MPDTGLTIVGAGVVGLAVAAQLASRFPGLVILERHERHGQETSSRSSEVVHAGLYYPPGSLKARLCVEGRDRLYELCRARGIGHRRIGKLVVATDAEEAARLGAIAARAAESGATVEPVTAAQARALEPHVRCVAALHSPDTGIVSAHELMDALLATARGAGAILQPSARVAAVTRVPGGYEIAADTPGGRESFTTEALVNAAGLGADGVAAMAGIDVDAAGYRQHPAAGRYLATPPRLWGMVSRLVYPTPGAASHAASLGIHAVVDLGGRLRFGPDIAYGSRDHAVDPALARAFGPAIRRYLPEVRDEDLLPDMAGIRAKLQGPGEPFRDFVIAEEGARGLPGLVNLLGIESPGLTAALAIARYVSGLLA